MLDYPVGQLEDADAASGEQSCGGLQHSTRVALALGAEKGIWVKPHWMEDVRHKELTAERARLSFA